MNYMGIDHHKQGSHVTVLDEGGKDVKVGWVRNTNRDMEDFLEELEDEIKAVVEAGRSSYAMVDLLEDLGIEVAVAHPSDVKAIAKAKIKTDKRDSRILAHLLRANLIPAVYRRSGRNRQEQRVMRQRMFFVRMMTRVKNRIKALLAQQREEVQRELEKVRDIFTKKGVEVVKEIELGGTDKQLLEEMFEFYWHLKERIKRSDEMMLDLYKRLPEAKIIDTAPGFDKFFSVLVATEIGDVRRFESDKKLHSYAGVIPSTHSSGERTYHGKIIKQGNRWLRWAVIEAVQPACKKDFDIRRFYQKHAKRKGHNAAKVATARRLLTIIYKMLKERRDFIPYKRDKSAAL